METKWSSTITIILQTFQTQQILTALCEREPKLHEESVNARKRAYASKVGDFPEIHALGTEQQSGSRKVTFSTVKTFDRMLRLRSLSFVQENADIKPIADSVKQYHMSYTTLVITKNAPHAYDLAPRSICDAMNDEEVLRRHM